MTSRPCFGAGLAAFLSLALFAAAHAATSVAAAPVGLPDRAQSMRVVIVRDTTPGCAPSCAEWIAAQGKLEVGTRVAFDKVLHTLGPRRLPVFIDSLGGSVNDAMAIGRHIRARHLDVVVTRTAFDAAAPGPHPAHDEGVPGRPHGFGSVCASACVLILAAGTKREVAPWTVVGVHQMIVHETMTRMQRTYQVVTRTAGGEKYEVGRTLLSERPVASFQFNAEASRKVYDNVAAYLAQMGITPAMMPLMRDTPSLLIHRLTREEEIATAIVTDPVDGEYVAGRSRIPETPPRSVPEQAFYAVATADPAKPKVSAGRVVWSLDPSPTAPTSDAQAALRAEGDIPDVGLGFVLRIAPPAKADVPPVIDLTFMTTPGSVEIRTIQRIGAPQARAGGTGTTLYTLPATIRSVGDKAYQIRLVGGSARWVVDQGMLADRPWLDIPMLVNGAMFAKITIEHAGSGTSLIRRALQAWSVARGDTPTTNPPAPLASSTSPPKP